MTHFVGVEACWHEVQSGTGTARERGEERVQPATHRKTVTHTRHPHSCGKRQTPVNLDKTHSLERTTPRREKWHTFPLRRQTPMDV